MKNCKRRTIFSWIFAFVLLIPMFSIAIRCLYVVINKNAYQSYSDDYIQSKQDISNSTLLQEDVTYYFINDFDTTSGVNTSTWIYYYKTINIDWTDYGAQSNNYIGFRFLRLGHNGSYYVWLYPDTSTHQQINIGNINLNITFVLDSVSDTGASNVKGGQLFTYIYKQDKLDNVFEYSIQQFVDKHGNGLINFFGLLEQYFMQSTTANALYFTFANWCLNYVLLVSCVWLLFSVLMWFINYCNYMLNTSFRKGHGD